MNNFNFIEPVGLKNIILKGSEKYMESFRNVVRVTDEWWENHQEMYFGDFKKIMMVIPEITKVVYDTPNNTTIVYFADGTKEIARVMEGDTFDKEVGVMQCIVKKMYGSRSRWLKSVVDRGVDRGVEVRPKKKKEEKINKFGYEFKCISRTGAKLRGSYKDDKALYLVWDAEDKNYEITYDMYFSESDIKRKLGAGVWEDLEIISK